MKPMHFTALTAVTFLCLTAAWVTTPKPQLTSSASVAGQAVFPDLSKSIKDLAALEVRAGEASFKAVKTPDGRFVEEATGYPVSDEALRGLIHSMTLAEFAEAKTKDPARHDALHLSTAGSDAREILLKEGDGQPLAHLVVGKSDYTLGGAQGGQYLRRGGDDQAWLARARISIPSSRVGWFETALIARDGATVSRVALKPQSGSELILERQGEALRLISHPDLALDDSKADRLMRLASNLRFTDVRKSDPAQAPIATAAASISEAGDLTLSLIESSDAGHWLRLESSSPELVDPARVAGFDFLISTWSADPLSWSADDLAKNPEG